jgi:hypothetical protein
MSYSIAVHPIAVYEQTQTLGLDFDEVCNYIEKAENLVDFMDYQMEAIVDHLKYRKYKLERTSAGRKDYSHEEEGSVSVMLTNNALFFNARGEGIMEITMTALEFKSSYGLKGFFAVFDAQNKGWQV